MSKTLALTLMMSAVVLCGQDATSQQQQQQYEQLLRLQQLQMQQAMQQATMQPSVVLATAAPGPKKPGVPRIGVVAPKAQMGQGSGGYDVGEPIRHAIIAFLGGPAVEVIPILSKIEIQSVAEAKEKQCDYVLTTAVTQSHGGGGWKKAVGAVAPLAGAVPMLGSVAGGAGGAIASTGAIAAMGSLGTVSASVRAKDEITFEYALMSLPGRETVVKDAAKLKAKRDGEDVLSPLIERAASTILMKTLKQ